MYCFKINEGYRKTMCKIKKSSESVHPFFKENLLNFYKGIGNMTDFEKLEEIENKPYESLKEIAKVIKSINSVEIIFYENLEKFIETELLKDIKSLPVLQKRPKIPVGEIVKSNY